MKRGGGNGGKRKINLNASSASARPTFVESPPLKPQRKLLAALLVGFAAWVSVLFALYFTTIHPRDLPAEDDTMTR